MNRFFGFTSRNVLGIVPFQGVTQFWGSYSDQATNYSTSYLEEDKLHYSYPIAKKYYLLN